jgi:hypothetical protein
MGCYQLTDNYIHTPIKGWFCQFECEEKLSIFEDINKSSIYENILDKKYYFQAIYNIENRKYSGLDEFFYVFKACKNFDFLIKKSPLVSKLPEDIIGEIFSYIIKPW